MIETKFIKNDYPYLKDSKIRFRAYQLSIANACINKNALVVIPTGLGKTIIAVLVVAKALNIAPPKSKVIILAPSKPLINQHYKSFIEFLSIPQERFAVLTGNIHFNKRTLLFKDHSIIFFTPQTLRNDLVYERYDLKKTCLIVFDEAHHASGRYPYSLIAEKFVEQNPDGNILALTASPGATKSKITNLCKNLKIPIDNIHIRTRNDYDVKDYLKRMDIYKVGTKLNSLMKDVYDILIKILEERLRYLSHVSFLNIDPNKVMYSKVLRKDLVKLNKELENKIINNKAEKVAFAAISINAQALIIYHMLELIEQQGLDVLLKYLEKINKKAKRANSSKAQKIIVADRGIRKVYLELKKNLKNDSRSLIHPKIRILIKILENEIRHNLGSRILVFVKLRDSITNIVEKLEPYKEFKCSRFVGQTHKSENDKGLTQKKQIEILRKFKEGIYNILISTNVGEEGLDITECDLVVFYDVVASEIRMIQRKGRTARQRKGKVVILYTKGTRDEVYLNIALHKLKKMNVNLKNPKELKNYQNLEESEKKRLILKNDSYNEALNPDFCSIKNRKIIKQSNLSLFLNQESVNKANKAFKMKSVIRISKLLNMKYGLRKSLSKNNFIYDIVDSDNDIELFNEIVIKIYSPKDFDESVQIENNIQLSKKFSVVINVFDFIEFKEEIINEVNLYKKKIINFGKENNIKIIIINNYEELFFIIKSILYEHMKN